MMLTLTVRTDKALAALRSTSQQVKFGRVRALTRAAIIVEGEAKRRAPHDTGRLRASITHELRGDSEAAVGTNVIYARIQEFGGIIKPVRARMLTIPIAPESRRKRAADFPGLFALKGKKVLAQRKGKRLRFLFALAEQVTIKEKRYLRGALQAKRAAVLAEFERMVNEVVRKNG